MNKIAPTATKKTFFCGCWCNYFSPLPCSGLGCSETENSLYITGPAEANFHWSGLYETFLCNNLNEVVVAQRAREGFALANLGGPGACSPGKFWIFGLSRMQFLGVLANLATSLNVILQGVLVKGIAFVHTPTKCIATLLLAVSVQGQGFFDRATS